MAWFQNLAGRAEDLLNKIDKNAATVLNESKIELEPQEEHTNPVVLEDNDEMALINDGSNSLNITNSFSFQNSPIREIAEDPHTQSIDHSAVNIPVDVNLYEKEKSTSGSVNNENIVDKSFKSSAKSDQLSTSSSLNNSFILVEESKILYEKIAKLEFENQDLSKQLLNMQHLYSEMRNENINLQFQIERCNEQVAQAQTEKDQYIARAQHILQEKEKLIALKQDSLPNEEANIFGTYNEGLKKELDFLHSKNDELIEKNNQLTKDIQSLQMQHRIIQNGLQQSVQSLENTILTEKKFRAIAEEECSQKMKELYLMNQELHQLKELVNAKDIEINELKEAAKQKTAANINEDIESRIKSLTQTLMIKQNKLETVTTERNALSLQIEKLESEYKKNLAQLCKTQAKVVNIREPDETVSLPRFFRVSPFDAGVTRRVKHAYSTLDAISVRTGIFLRRYPVARVLVFSYMVLLHIWVLVILFLYAPTNR